MRSVKFSLLRYHHYKVVRLVCQFRFAPAGQALAVLNRRGLRLSEHICTNKQAQPNRFRNFRGACAGGMAFFLLSVILTPLQPLYQQNANAAAKTASLGDQPDHDAEIIAAGRTTACFFLDSQIRIMVPAYIRKLPCFIIQCNLFLQSRLPPHCAGFCGSFCHHREFQGIWPCLSACHVRRAFRQTPRNCQIRGGHRATPAQAGQTGSLLNRSR